LAISFAFLLAASPFLVWAWLAGGVEVGRMLLAVAVLVFVLAVVCAMGLMFSTLTARTISSAVLTYLAVAALTFGTVIAFLISMPIMANEQTVRVKVVPDSFFQSQPANPDGTGLTAPPAEGPTAADCVYANRKQMILHTERTWWLLALNPFVVVADAAPSRNPVNYLGFEPLQMISDGARSARMGTTGDSLNECWPETQPTVALGDGTQQPQDQQAQERQAREQQQQLAKAERDRLNKVPSVWPYGFVFLVAVRRLRTPIRRLPRGTRIA